MDPARRNVFRIALCAEQERRAYENPRESCLDTAVEIAAALAGVLGVVTASLRDLDLAVPFSQERIVVVMPHTKEEGALRVARRLCAGVREHRAQPGRTRVTASVGVATHAGDLPDPP